MATYYPPVGFHFEVRFNIANGTESDSRFQEVTGLTAEITTEEVKEGGLNQYTHKLPQRSKYGNLILKRGMLTDSAVVKWIWDAVENFEFSLANIEVTLLNEQLAPLQVWSFIGAYPVKYSISDFKAENSELVVETLELAYRYLRKGKVNA